MDPATLFGLLSMSLGAGALSDIGSSAVSILHGNYASRKQYKYNLALQKQAQAWQERMSNTAHQREVRDLRAAGLNPILSASGGSGASFSNASGSSVSAPAANIDFDLGINSAANLAQTIGNLELQESQKKLNGTVSDLNQADKVAKEAQAELFRAQAQQARATAKDISSGMPVNRIPGAALNTISSFLQTDLFQNAASQLFINDNAFNKRVDSWYNQRRSEWQSRRNMIDHPLKVPGQKDEVKLYKGFKR